MCNQLHIADDDLKEITEFIAKKTVGKILKKADILEAKPLLKAIIKESIYEEFRELLYTVRAYNKGATTQVYKLTDRG